MLPDAGTGYALGKLDKVTAYELYRVTDSRLEAICEQLIQLKTASHPALAKVHLRDLEYRMATRVAVHSSFPDAKRGSGNLDTVTVHNLRFWPQIGNSLRAADSPQDTLIQ